MNENFEQNNTSIPEEDTSTNPDSGNTRMAKSFFEWLETFAFAFAFVLIFFTFAFKIVTVDGDSMNNTLINGEKLIISNLFYTPETGDIVIVSRERYNQEPIVKRVIATEGQTVDINYETREIRVDGVLLDEEYAYYDGDKMNNFYHCPESFVVGENMIFVLGDNRNHSLDSRGIGTFDVINGEYVYSGLMNEDIIGKVLVRFLPVSKFGSVN